MDLGILFRSEEQKPTDFERNNKESTSKSRELNIDMAGDDQTVKMQTKLAAIAVCEQTVQVWDIAPGQGGLFHYLKLFFFTLD